MCRWKVILKYVVLRLKYSRTGHKDFLYAHEAIYRKYIVDSYGEIIDDHYLCRYLLEKVYEKEIINYRKLAHDIITKCTGKAPLEKDLKLIVTTLKQVPRSRLSPSNVRSIINIYLKNGNK